MPLPYYGYDTKHYATEYLGHDVELVFDKKLLVMNRAILIVDGVKVDSERMFFGQHELEVTLDDGTAIRVELVSGLAGEMAGAELVAADGTRQTLVERAATDQTPAASTPAS